MRAQDTTRTPWSLGSCPCDYGDAPSQTQLTPRELMNVIILTVLYMEDSTCGPGSPWSARATLGVEPVNPMIQGISDTAEEPIISLCQVAMSGNLGEK